MELDHTKFERYLYATGVYANYSDSPVNDIYCTSVLNRMKQMKAHEDVQEKNKETVRKDRNEDVQLPAKPK